MNIPTHQHAPTRSSSTCSSGLATACVERGESVLVSAHTSAGKTVVAEHAIAAALRDKGRVVYSSPIKALSNQKYRELQASFGDVGLQTGDVTINEDASCLVMTTEVLRIMLYQGSTVMREIQWVVFDEVHMLGSADRGWVVEETLMLLPPACRVVLLSATMPNALEIAEWLADLRGQPVHVVHTTFRPTPLKHYVCPLKAEGLYEVQDEHGTFNEAEWQSAVGGLPKPKPPKAVEEKVQAAAGAGDPDSDRAQKRANELIRVVSRFRSLEMLPAIVFCFSRRECELVASKMAKATQKVKGDDGEGNEAPLMQMLSAEEIEQVEQVFQSAVAVLAEEDGEMRQVKALLPMLCAGVGVHHSGMLPVLRELVELLFAEGLLKVLFATETLAMGLNLPARTVVFSAAQKFDGTGLRLLKPTEYTQMAGRAGRRGLDSQGYSVVLLSQWLGAEEGEEMLSGGMRRSARQFRLRFSTQLKLLRTEGVDSSVVLTRNLRSWQQQCAGKKEASRRRVAKEELTALTQQAENSEVDKQADEYLGHRAELQRMASAFEVAVRAHAQVAVAARARGSSPWRAWLGSCRLSVCPRPAGWEERPRRTRSLATSCFTCSRVPRASGQRRMVTIIRPKVHKTTWRCSLLVCR